MLVMLETSVNYISWIHNTCSKDAIKKATKFSKIMSSVRTEHDLNQPKQTQRHWVDWLPVTLINQPDSQPGLLCMVGCCCQETAASLCWLSLRNLCKEALRDPPSHRRHSPPPPPYLPCLSRCWWQNATYRLRQRERGTNDDRDILFHNGLVPCVTVYLNRIILP